MNIVKRFFQILSAILYTCLFATLIWLIMVAPLNWAFSLPLFRMICFFALICVGFNGILLVVYAFLFLPYQWFCKGNTSAVIVSIIVFLCGMIKCGIDMWRVGPHGFWQILGVSVLSIVLIELSVAFIKSFTNTTLLDD